MSSRRDAAFILALIVVAAVLPLVVGALAGSLEIPRNDDWSYRRIATTLATTGRLEMDGAAETMLLGQIALTQPLLWLSGGQPWAFTVAGFAFAIAAVVAAYVMARQILTPGRAAVAALMLPLFPGYLAYATSYMNDVPAMAAQFATVALGALAVRRRPVAFGWLCAAVLVGCLAFSMRQFAVAAPAAVLLVAICAEPRRLRTRILAIGTVAVCLGIQTFRSSLPGQLGEVDKNLAWALQLPPAIITVAFVVLPAALIAIATSSRFWHRRDVALGTLLGLGMVAIQVTKWVKWDFFPDVLMGNLVTQWGVPSWSYLHGSRPLLFETPAWVLINVVALAAVVIAGAALVGVAGMHLRGADRSPVHFLRSIGTSKGTIATFTLLAGGGLALFGLLFPVFDRYLWPIAPALAALLMADPPAMARARDEGSMSTSSARGSAIAYGGLLALVAAIFMTNSAAFDAARWTAGARLVAAGVSAEQVDAGYEWVGFHSTRPATPARPVPASIWYLGWWRNFEMCGVASSGEFSTPDAVFLGKVTYRLQLVTGPEEELWLYRIDSPACRKGATP